MLDDLALAMDNAGLSGMVPASADGILGTCSGGSVGATCSSGTGVICDGGYGQVCTGTGTIGVKCTRTALAASCSPSQYAFSCTSGAIGQVAC